jgi:hypothetical protein
MARLGIALGLMQRVLTRRDVPVLKKKKIINL